MAKKLKIGIVGCGGICRWAHLPAYAKMDNVEIVAFCDIIAERAVEMTRCEFGGKKPFSSAHTYSDFDEFLKDGEIESVDICTPNYLHSPFAVKALEAGKHVFSEKPDSVSVEDVIRMKEAAEKNHRHLMVMRNNRFENASTQMKKYIDEGKAGDIYCGRCGWVRRRGIPGKGGWFTTKAQSGGGPLIDLGVHMIDLAIWLMGNPTPVAVSGSIFNKFADNDADADSANAAYGDSVAEGTFDVEDLAMGFIKFDNGACLQIEFSWASNIKEERNFVELRGSKAGFTWENAGTVCTIYTEDKKGKLTDIPLDIDNKIGGHEGNLRHYVDVVLNGTEPCFRPQQGVDMIKILSAIYKSSATGREVIL